MGWIPLPRQIEKRAEQKQNKNDGLLRYIEFTPKFTLPGFCRRCGANPYPNRWFCPACHTVVTRAYGTAIEMGGHGTKEA